MSKNMKFLRKGALLLAVLAMVLGQCFGMLGGVAAQAAGEKTTVTVDDIASLEWVSVPEQVINGAKTEAVLAVTLKKAEDAVFKDATLNGIEVYYFRDNGTLYVRAATFEKITADATAADVTVNVKVSWATPANPNEWDVVALDKAGVTSGTKYSDLTVLKLKSDVKTVKVVNKPTDSYTGKADTIKAYAYDETTGLALSTTPAYKFGEQMDNIVVEAFVDGTSAGYADGYTVRNLTTGKAVSGKTITTDGAFVEGANRLMFTYDGVASILTVNVELADTATALTVNTWGGTKWDTLTSPVAGDAVPVKLTAAVTETIDKNFAALKDGETNGSVIFYDGDTVLAVVPLGSAVDEVPASGSYKKVTTAGGVANAVYAFVATKGDHEFSAEYVADGAMAAWVGGSATEKPTKLTVGLPEYEYNYATLTFDDALLRFESTNVTLSFDAPVSAGEATVTFTNGGKTEELVFVLNDTDTEYTKAVSFNTIGAWTPALKVTFDEDTELQTTTAEGAGAPNKITKGTETPVTPKMPKGQAATIAVCEAEAAISLAADVTTGLVGDDIELTATVTTANGKDATGTVDFYGINEDGDEVAIANSVAIKDGVATATTEFKSDIVAVVAKFIPADYTYTPATSNVVALTLTNLAGALEIVAPEEPVAATGKASFTIKVLDENGDQDLTFKGSKSATWTIGNLETAVSPSFVAGEATVTIDAKQLNAGTQTVTFTVKDAIYGTLTGTATFTVEEPELTATKLVIADDALKATAAMGDAIATRNVTVTVKDTYGLGTYTAATGSVELYLGDALVATKALARGVATFTTAELKALTGGEDLVLTAKYLGDKVYAASQVTGDKKIDVTKLTTAMTVAVDGNELTITLNVPAGYTPNGKLVITSGETTLATIDAVEAENVVTVANPALAGEQDVTVAFTGDSGMTDATKTVKVTFEAVSGWYENPKGTWYYFKEGEMLTDEWVQDGFWYYLGADGVMVKGWKQLGWNGATDWYYFKTYAPNSGSMMTGWQFLGGEWYYMASSGKMLTGWQQLGGKWYYLDPVNGDMKTGWQQLGGKWYYMDPTNGDMKTGWQKVGNTWYYMNASGAMVTGWQQLSWNGVTNWYYFQSSGAMATSGTIDGWNIASSGIATPAN